MEMTCWRPQRRNLHTNVTWAYLWVYYHFILYAIWKNNVCVHSISEQPQKCTLKRKKKRKKAKSRLHMVRYTQWKWISICHAYFLLSVLCLSLLHLCHSFFFFSSCLFHSSPALNVSQRCSSSIIVLHGSCYRNREWNKKHFLVKRTKKKDRYKNWASLDVGVDVMWFAFAFMHIVNIIFLMFDTLNSWKFCIFCENHTYVDAGRLIHWWNPKETQDKHVTNKHCSHSFSGHWSSIDKVYRIDLFATVIRCMQKIKWKLKVDKSGILGSRSYL